MHFFKMPGEVHHSYCSSKAYSLGQSGSKPSKMPSQENPKCLHIFIDGSNIFLGAQQTAAIFSRLKEKRDIRVRIDSRAFKDLITDDREVHTAKWYGSSYPKKGRETWHLSFENNGWEVYIVERPRDGHKEKQIDTQIATDITSLVNDLKVIKGTIVLGSGDQDMIPCINECMKRKWRVEIWGWKSTISKFILQLKDRNPNFMRIRYLDVDIARITFIERKTNCFQEETTNNTTNNVYVHKEVVQAHPKTARPKPSGRGACT